MAFRKTVEQSTGTVAEYHRITKGTIDFTTGHTTVEFASYRDEAARSAAKLPIAGGSVTIPEMPSFTGDPRIWAYAKLKERPEWADAEDV